MLSVFPETAAPFVVTLTSWRENVIIINFSKDL